VTAAATVAVASCREAIDEAHDEDEPLLLDALRSCGLQVGVWAWDDHAAPWAEHDLVLVRSTWDYTSRREEFLDWAANVAAATDLANGVETLRWNTDKRYLAQLAELGLPVVPTTFLAPGDDVRLGLEGQELVVKPTVSGGSQDTGRYPAQLRAAAEQHAGRLLDAGREVMVQPYLAAIDEQGETAVIHLGGSYSHGMRKGPLLSPDGSQVDGLFAVEQMSVRQPSAQELAVAERILAEAPLPEPPLYARVDLLPGPDGAPVLLELELSEPSLFLAHVPEAAQRVADAVLARLAA
jgi:hypothetical protein